MKKILLTSAGFETPRIMSVFLELLMVPVERAKALFIPTAAQDVDAIAVLPECVNDLLRAGISKENITVFDLHDTMADEELQKFDVVYFAGGNARYLLQRINGTGFNQPLARFIGQGGIYVGVSAGSIVAANNLPDNLEYFDRTLHVHAPEGTACGVLDISSDEPVYLTNESAVLISDDKREIIG